MNSVANRIGIGVILKYVILIIFVVSNVFPLVWIFMSSLKTNQEFMANILSFPKSLSFTNYIQAWGSSNFVNYFFNSIYVTVISIILIIILSVMIAFALARYRFKLRKFIYFFFLLGMLIPVQTTLVPLFIMFRSVHALNSLPALLVLYVGFGLPLAIFILESFIRTTVPIELDEAAKMDGGNTYYLLVKIIAPICSPAIATVCIMTFLFVWNDFAFPLVFINEDKLKTLQFGLMSYVGNYSTQYTLMMAALVMSIIPILLIYFIFQRYLIKGMVAGAVKE